MKKTSLLLCLCGLFFTQPVFAQALKVEKSISKKLKKVKPESIKGHIQYLADDKLKGRKPGTEGYQMAVDYVTDEFKKMGAEPGGENNTYLQKVRLRTATTAPSATFTSIDASGKQEVLTYGKDFSIYPNPQEKNVTVEAPLVFAGYGITAPDLGYDDYANVDAKGKIVVVLRGAPASFPSTVSLYSMDMLTILENAAAHGAVGVLVGATAQGATPPTFAGGVNSVMGADGNVAFSRSFASDQIKMLGMVNYETLQKYLATANLKIDETMVSLKSGKTVSAPIAYSAKASYTSQYKDIESYNVIGKITGSDPVLKNEYVVHSAHLDHMGIGRPINGDSIYNGAHDNASGVASLLEIAKLYSKMKVKPKRSVLVVMVTAEEMGLLGSAYFAKFPTVPAKSIVADINTDMPTLIAPLLSVVPLGANHSSLQKEVQQAAAYLNLDVEEDPEPEQNRFIRSDQYSFVTAGIPALHIKYGNKTADGQNNLNKTVEAWRATTYHKPQDNPDGVFDYDAAKKYVQLNFLISLQVAQAPQRPTWNPGDFFGTRFAL
ncbi:M28 family peptidase [Pontibacter arcticus]|uniref:Peptidase M28 n=1 Tax=Pontibacter arcticus TaxID=2080288 RepID=A0A364RCB0_9BACT|nr:M28 family peptidase [Pontibacter arcticus]RAU81796.1 peptidase M28 [Pontibacter arcticus]